jgi:protein involved in polysaccharide export with SLBB domain
MSDAVASRSLKARRIVEMPPRFLLWLAVLASLLALGQSSYAQSPVRPHSEVREPELRRSPEASELANENYSRAAASGAQIKTVLAKDVGLMVELKRWVAQEATSNGQIVEDADLSDEAIFDRLDRDIAFRSVATRLLQRYGYLRPAPNPDSDLGKEQEFVLKERARRMVALEMQDDNSLRPGENGQQGVERTAACEPRQDDTCEQQSSSPSNSPSKEPGRNRIPGTDERIPAPVEPLPSLSEPRTLRADIGTNLQSGDRPALEFELTPSSLKSFPDATRSRQDPNPSTLDGLVAGNRSLTPGDDVPNPSYGSNGSNGSKRPTQRHLEEEDVTPVRMVHKSNPYADVPSLYDMYVQASVFQRPAERFGLDIFRNTSKQSDAIPMDLPVGPDYVVGPGDSLSIDLWGGVSQRFVRIVDREGRVALPEAGPVLVNGKSLDEVQFSIQRVLRTQFRDVSVDVSLSRLRTVRVYIVGDVAQPGAYDISSLSTPLNALFAAGGVTGRGSLRALKHYRGKQLVQEVDAYDLLLHGVRSDLKRLENGDTLMVPPMGPQVTVEGMVRRPAIYEMLNEASLADVLELAGGILPTAALRHIEVQRVEAHEKHTMLTLDLGSTSDATEVTQQLEAFKIHGGDQVHIFPIASYNQNSIFLQGHVLRPGRYSYKKGMKLTDLIASYSDLLPEPASHYAEIVRLNAPDFHPSVESFDLSAALANPAAGPTLQPLDTVRVFSRFDFEPPPDVWVGGEVRAPGKYRTSGQAHLRDAIYLSGGITPDASLDTAQLFRTQADGTMRILSVDLKQALAGNPVDNILLQPRDRIIVHRSSARVDPPTVYVKGEVAKPGRYPLTSDMHVGDLVRVAGGLKRSADPETADLTRFAAGNSPSGSPEQLDVKLAAVLSGDAAEDVPLHNGDVLTVRQVPQWEDLGASVIVRGEVQHPATYGIEPGERLSSVLRRSGGFNAQAYPYGAILIRREVRELQMKSHLDLIERLKTEERYLKALPESDEEQKNAKLTAIAETDTTLQQLQTTGPIGRVVIHLPSDAEHLARFAGSPADVQLRNGDELVIPKKNNYVMVSGQVLNPTAVSYLPGKSAKWYLSQAGGMTQIAAKNAVFVVRGDGSVISSKNNSALWSGDPMAAVLKPGDSIIVPEKAPKIGNRNWATVLQAAQVASSLALTVAYIHP